MSCTCACAAVIECPGAKWMLPATCTRSTSTRTVGQYSYSISYIYSIPPPYRKRESVIERLSERVSESEGEETLLTSSEPKMRHASLSGGMRRPGAASAVPPAPAHCFTTVG